jgi:DNA-binding response OmpR family regulator
VFCVNLHEKIRKRSQLGRHTVTDASRTSGSRSLRGLAVLYVDDDASVCVGVTRLLVRAGASCHVARSHAEAVTWIEDDPTIRLAILDYHMPDGDVADLIWRLRVARPDLLLVGTSGDERGTDFANRGVDGFLPKPWKVDDLLERCGSLLPSTGPTTTDAIESPRRRRSAMAPRGPL